MIVQGILVALVALVGLVTRIVILDVRAIRFNLVLLFGGSYVIYRFLEKT